MRGAFALAGSKYRYANPHGLPSLIGVRDGENITATWSHTMPQTLIERRSFPPQPASPVDLPFVADVKIGPRKKACCFWHVQPTDDHGHANDVGRQFAADYAQYLKDNPQCVGANYLGHIIDDMAKYRHTPANGYAVGFWSFLERLIYLAVSQNDPYEIADYYAQRYAAIKAAREQEVDHA